MRIVRKAILALAITVAGTNGLSSNAPAQVIEIATAAGGVASSALLAKGVQDIIADARLAASGLLAEGKSTGNALITRGADELNASTDNAVRMLSASMDKKFGALNDMEQKLLLGVARATVAAKALTDKAYLAKDTLSLDVRSIVGNLPLTTEVFVLQRVAGLTQLQKNSEYKMQVIGSYVGLPASGYKTDISLEIAGKKVEGLRIDPVQLHVANLAIPQATLEPQFKSDAIAIVEAQLNIEYTHPESFLIFWSRDKKETISTKLHLVLYPLFAGEMDVAAKQVVYGWKSISSDSQQQIGPNAHCSKNCGGHFGIPFEFTITVPGGERSPQIVGDIRIVGVDCRPVPGHNGFDEDIRGYSSTNKTRGHCHFRARSQPSTYLLTVSREQWGPTSDTEVKSKVRATYNELIEVRLPSDATVVRLRGKTLSGETFDYLAGEVDPASPVELVNKVANASDVSWFFRIQRPADLD